MTLDYYGSSLRRVNIEFTTHTLILLTVSMYRLRLSSAFEQTSV